MTRGLQSPSSTIQRAWHRIGNRIRKAIQPVPNAYEDAAQTIGGRKTHGDKSDGVYRKARPPATHSATPLSQRMSSRSVFTNLSLILKQRKRKHIALRRDRHILPPTQLKRHR